MGKLTKSGFARAKSELGYKGKLTRKQVQRVFKRAIKKLGRKKSSPSKSRSKTKTKTKKRNPKSGGSKNMGKRGSNIQQKVFKWLRIGALAAPGAIYAAQPIALDQKVNEILRVYTGVNVKHSIESNELQFDWKRLAMGWTPFLAAVLTTYGIPKIAGLIRRI